jgi:hypothetical protein
MKANRVACVLGISLWVGPSLGGAQTSLSRPAVETGLDVLAADNSDYSPASAWG